MEIKGYCDDRFAGVKEAFTNNFIEGKEKGASVCIHHAGTKAVDLWAGSADREGKREWQEDTIVNIASGTKGFGSACIHLLCDRGLLDLDAPVARYWPEFQQAGKKDLPVRHLLSHRAGLAAVKKALPVDALFDWDRMCDELAAQKPWWKPGLPLVSGCPAPTSGSRIISRLLVMREWGDPSGSPILKTSCLLAMR